MKRLHSNSSLRVLGLCDSFLRGFVAYWSACVSFVILGISPNSLYSCVFYVGYFCNRILV